MLAFAVAAFAVYGISEILAAPPQCDRLADCLRKANDEMMKCTTKVDAIDISKLKGGEFEQCSTMVKDGMARVIRAHDSLTTAAVKCLAGTVKLDEFTCESEFFPNEKNIPRFRRQVPDLIAASKQADAARKCGDRANKMRDQCFEHKEGCTRAALCLLCFEQSQTHNAMNKAVFDSTMGFLKCIAKMGVPLDKVGDDEHANGDHEGGK